MSETIHTEENPGQECGCTPDREPSARPAPPPEQAGGTPPRPQRVRRVGTLTMGLSLIAAGVIALICLFAPTFDIVTVLRFSPLVLIFLGVEILLSNLIFRNDRLKYDFWSGAVCFFLICASVGVAILPPLYEQYGPGRERLRVEIARQAEALCYDSLKDEKAIQSMHVNLYLNGGLSDYQDATVQSLSRVDNLYLRFQLSGDLTTKEKFAQEAHALLGRISALPFRPSQVSFFYKDNAAEHPRAYELTLSGAFAMNQDAAGLARMVDDSSEWDRLEEDRERLEEERQALYDEIEEERQTLYNEIEEERQQLAQEREEMQEDLSEERESLYGELEEQRELLAEEREQMNADLQQQREAFDRQAS